jgi:hypothetical protein
MNGQALRDRPLDRASMTPFFTAFRTAFSIFLTALVCFLAVVQSLRSEDDCNWELHMGASLSSLASLEPSEKPTFGLDSRLVRRWQATKKCHYVLVVSPVPFSAYGTEFVQFLAEPLRRHG